MNKKRLDVVVKYFFPLAAGIEVNVMNVYSYFARNGWDVYVHTTTDMPDAPDSLSEREEINGLHVCRYKWHWYGFVPDIKWGETKALCLHNFDIFPHSWLFVKIAILRFIKKSEIKLFLTPHGGFTPEWPIFPFWQRVIKKFYHNTIGVFFVNNLVDGLRSVSEWERDKTIKLGVKPELVETIQNGLEKEVLANIDECASEKAKKTVDSLGTYMIQIGRIHPIKNQKVAIKALKELPEEISFVMIGPVTDFAYEKELKETIKDLNLEKRVHFLGVVTGFDKYYLLNKALLGVHMARWESYCNAVHEYMSQKRVCIVSEKTALEELIKDGINGFCVGVDDEHALAEKVAYIFKMRGSQEIKKMEEENFKFTKGHSWDAIASRVESFYNEKFDNK